MSVTNTAAFGLGNYGSVAQQFGQYLDTSGDDEVLLALSFGFHASSGLSTTNYTWFEFAESDSPISSISNIGTAIDYSSGRITLPTGYTRHASAAASEVFRLTSGFELIFAMKAFRIVTGERYLCLRVNRAAGTNTIPMSGVWTYGLPLASEENMAFTYDVSTDIGKVRMLITDRDESRPVFQDAEIQAYLDLEDSSIRRAAAAALETMASDQALVLKVIVTLDLETDGAKVSDALMKRAAVLRKTEDETGAFDIAEMITNDFGDREWFDGAIRRGE